MASGIPTPFNMTNISDVSGIVELANKVNSQLMKGQLGLFILITVFMITFFAFLKTTGDGLKSMTASLFVCFILSTLVAGMGLVGIGWVYTLLGALVLFAIFIIVKG